MGRKSANVGILLVGNMSYSIDKKPEIKFLLVWEKKHHCLRAEVKAENGFCVERLN